MTVRGGAKRGSDRKRASDKDCVSSLYFCRKSKRPSEIEQIKIIIIIIGLDSGAAPASNNLISNGISSVWDSLAAAYDNKSSERKVLTVYELWYGLPLAKAGNVIDTTSRTVPPEAHG